MKKVNLNGKLSLNKETIAKLNDDQMNSIKGGATHFPCIVTQGQVGCLPQTRNGAASCAC